MNVFVLCTGRCGSTTFTRAASHMSNYTAGHESRVTRVGSDRFAYPPNHVEVDNRLAWMLGRLEQSFGKDAFGIISAYRNGILFGAAGAEPYDVCVDMIQTVDANISAFLADKPRKMDFQMESAERDWPVFWNAIGAEGDFEASLADWKKPLNVTPPRRSLSERAIGKVKRISQKWLG